MTELTELVKKRGILKRQLTIFADYVDKLPEDLGECNIPGLELRYQRMEKVLAEFDPIQAEIELRSEEDKIGKDREEFENKYFEYMGMLRFLNRTDLLEIMQQNAHPSNAHPRAMASSAASGFVRRPKEQAFLVSERRQTQVCPKCTKEHTLYECEEFAKLTVKERYEEVPKLNVCFNCLRAGHFADHCWRGRCKKCQKKHSTLICLDLATSPTETPNEKMDPPNEKKGNDTTTTDSNSGTDSANIFMMQQNSQMLLSTVLVNIVKADGNTVTARALLDNCSTSCLMSEALCEMLNLPTKNVNKSVSAVNNLQTNLRKTCKAQVKSLLKDYQFESTFYVLPIISNAVPAYQIDVSELNIPHDIPLADPEFYLPSRVDLLLGADIFWDALENGRIKLGPNRPTVCETKFGWLASGNCPAPVRRHSEDEFLTCNFLSTETNINDNLTRFWELDECPIKPEKTYYSPEEKECEDHFTNNTMRTPDGRFCVKIPLKGKEDILDMRRGASANNGCS
ncbi:putative peptidase (DUF1758) domain-containing protein [Phthorimaea operculella]|nr:putative peptidase (DUF1758) domain-containing protein [Phthorimaea operculella]